MLLLTSQIVPGVYPGFLRLYLNSAFFLFFFFGYGKQHTQLLSAEAGDCGANGNVVSMVMRVS